VSCITLLEAVRRISRGGIILYPTETFFGIGCRADDEKAVRRVFALKNRPLNMALPLILGHAAQISLAAAWKKELDEDVEKLSSFWPGPLTLILPAKAGLPAPLCAETGTVALRVSSHPVARTLALACGMPIVSSSANISGRDAVTSAGALDPELLEKLSTNDDGVLDLPPEPGGGEASTMVKPLGNGRLIVYREGSIPLANLAEAGFYFVPKETA